MTQMQDKNMLAVGAAVLAGFNLMAWSFLCGCPMALLGIGLGYLGRGSQLPRLATAALVVNVVTFLLPFIHVWATLTSQPHLFH
jgi:hypothetical protein